MAKKGVTFHKISRARVVLDLDTPSSLGTFYSLEEEKVSLNFKYERFPYFGYSCGKIAH